MTDTGARRRRPSPQIVGLFLIFAATTGLALWQGSNHPSPSIFTDEIETAQLSRSLIETGQATLRGMPRGLAPLGVYVIAPLWLIKDVPTAYMLIKALGAILMALTVFPAYALARLAVRPGWALFAAAGAGISPALVYAPFLVKEPTAYPLATLALYLIARWVARPTAVGLVLAVAACLIAGLAKDQLFLVLFPVLGLCVLAVIWRGGRMSRFRTTWTRGDWVGAATLAVGALIVCGAFASSQSGTWYVTTTFFQGRMIDYGLWATGALAIGLGIVPLIAGLASLVRPKGEESQPGVGALAIVTVAAITCFGLYTAIKAAYLSTIFGTMILERNLIYLVPLLFAGTALFFQRRGGRWWAVVVAGCFALYLVHTTPYALTQYPNYEAHGLAIIALANRIFRWPGDTIEHTLIIVAIGATALLVLLPWLRGRQTAVILTSIIAAFTLAWTGTAEVYAAHGEQLFSEQLYNTLPRPANWLDKQTQGRSTVFLGQAIRDSNPINLLEFWNRSLTKVWALDGTAPGPGATATPNVERPDGKLTGPGTDYALTTPGVDVAGRRVGATVGGNTLVELEGGNLRLQTAQTGIYPDGWMGGGASFSLYNVPPRTRGHVHVVLSRAAWCGKDVRSEIIVEVGPVGIRALQPIIARVTDRATSVIHSCQVKRFVLRTPPQPWRVEVRINPTFVPSQIDPTLGDPRQLGALVSFSDQLDR